MSDQHNDQEHKVTMLRLTVDIPAEQMHALDRIQRKLGQTKAAQIRPLIVKHINEHDPKKQAGSSQ